MLAQRSADQMGFTRTTESIQNEPFVENGREEGDRCTSTFLQKPIPHCEPFCHADAPDLCTAAAVSRRCGASSAAGPPVLETTPVTTGSRGGTALRQPLEFPWCEAKFPFCLHVRSASQTG